MDSDNQDETAQPKRGLRERIGRRAWLRSAALVGGGLIAGGIIAGTVTANAADEGTTTPGSSTSQHDGRGHHGPRGDGDLSQPQRDDEELLTGATAEQVIEAVLAEYPDATIDRVETDSGGLYEAHIETPDDERLTVLVDEDFEVTGTESHD